MAKIYRDEKGRPVHPYVPEALHLLRRGRMSRREFLRTVTLLGVSAGAAYALAGGVDPLVRRAHGAETPRQGGTFRFQMAVQEITDPARYDWNERSNIARHIVEYLTFTGPDNVTRPYLAERWEASEDLRTWTFHLRKDVKWSNGDEFNADDVVFNFTRWLDPKTGSSNIGLFDAMVQTVDTGKTDADGKPIMGKRMRSGAVEKVDGHTVRLHLSQPVLAMPENLYNYPTAIVHRRFEEEGGDLRKNPVGTGPFTLERLAVGREALLRRRDGYWGQRPHLDAIHYVDLGEDRSAWLAALASDQVDGIYRVDVAQLDVVENLPGVVIHEVASAQTNVARMRVDQAPFDDIRVRRAVRACMDPRKLLELAHRGRGDPGEHHHVATIHPEYFALPATQPDIELARSLLAEAGHGEGLALSIDVGSTSGPWELACIQAFREQCAPAGIDLRINTMPSTQYWEIWDKTPFGFTAWTHRPLGVMVLNLGYRSGVPWNESRYSNPEFDAALDAADATLDVEERRRLMERVQRILQDDAVIAQPLWRSEISATRDRVRGYSTHPTLYHQFNDVWLA